MPFPRELLDVGAELRGRAAGTRHRWWVVPDYRPDGQPARSATVVDRAGQMIASFERLEDAERAVEAVNGRT